MSGFAALNTAPSLPLVSHRSRIVSTFADNAGLAGKIDEFLQTYPETVPLFQDIASYVSGLKNAQPPAGEETASQASKKRKIDGSAASAGSASGAWADRSARPDFVAPDVSFSIPQRKKLRLECIGSKSGGLRAVSAAGDLEFGLSWENIDQAFCLPVPEKAKKQHSFVVVPRGGDGLSAGPGAPECIVWTVNETAASEDNEKTAEPGNTARFLSTQLARFGKELIFPDEDEFASAIPTLKKGDKSYHVKAHRGSKDGYLFFLPPGILWVFKKPILFLPYAVVTSISYTSVLQRTFNLNVVAVFNSQDGAAQDQEVEFSMIDQADFAGIDAYIKRHGLNDASLAAGRRAKVYNVNKAKDGAAAEANGHEAAAGDAAGDGTEETELQKAERLLQDQEDDEEEDYVDDGSEGGSSEEDYEEGADNTEVAGEGAFDEAEEYDEEEGGYEDEGEAG